MTQERLDALRKERDEIRKKLIRAGEVNSVLIDVLLSLNGGDDEDFETDPGFLPVRELWRRAQELDQEIWKGVEDDICSC